MDVQLRSGNKEWTDEQMERLMDKVMVLFRFINGNHDPVYNVLVGVVGTEECIVSYINII